MIADSASQRDCHEVLRSFSLLIWPDNLNGKSKGFGNLHQIQEWEIRSLNVSWLHDKTNVQSMNTYTLKYIKAFPVHLHTKLVKKKGKQMQKNMHIHNQTYTCPPVHTKTNTLTLKKQLIPDSMDMKGSGMLWTLKGTEARALLSCVSLRLSQSRPF